MNNIIINKIKELPPLKTDFFDDILDSFRPFTLNKTLLNEKFPHTPVVSVKLFINEDTLQVKFFLIDKYVKSEVTDFNGPVCTDSCAEFFFSVNGNGYFNFEINAGGTVHSSFIRNCERTSNGFRDYTYLSEDDLRGIEIYSTMPKIVLPEIAQKTIWQLSYNIPLRTLEKYAGEFEIAVGTVWHGNLYKCADSTSHPHWLTYFPIIEGFNFHQPNFFGEIRINTEDE